MDLRRGINLAVEHVLADLKKRAKMISTTEEIAQVFWPALVMCFQLYLPLLQCFQPQPARAVIASCLRHVGLQECKLIKGVHFRYRPGVCAHRNSFGTKHTAITMTCAADAVALDVMSMLGLHAGRHNLCQWRKRDWRSDCQSHGACGQGGCHHCCGSAPDYHTYCSQQAAQYQFSCLFLRC